jgi:hypothetical protein
MQDDVWMLSAEGWEARSGGKPNRELIPPSLVIARYFPKEKAGLEAYILH